MADVKISQLTAASQVQDTDVLPMTSGSSTVKVSALQLKNHAISGLDASDSAVAGSYVTAVSETDGVISVTREAPMNQMFLSIRQIFSLNQHHMVH